MFSPPLALASLSGEADADWARAGADYAGAAFLGGIAIDDDSRAAARDLVARDRTEFLPNDPLAFIDRELAALEDVPIQPAFNVRSATPDPIPDAARVCRDRDALLEVNAHCRQDELCAVGCGEMLLRDADRLREYVTQAAETGATVGVKVRAEVPGVDLPALAQGLEAAGAAFVHIDAMDSESVVREVVDATDLFVIANNGVRDADTVREYVDYGADAVSVGRPSDNPDVLARVLAAVEEAYGLESTPSR
ncbi:tRNA-dihydrouridine synthase [Natronorubrum sulfidifaciens]|uniref:Dihydropyrimidine dehydrogenase n=1 Tax=Natronorubrum sulfidifaciens JCM 14089 TaxID=1230460 RepID=L9VZZ6_9EURY|nr:tRNA-dihydrouridine synthase [Natronorubrum sulfidifaciens]ELY42616.1 dihydropyrimidine dehydrogenase [Natronorubrum sulfidifaciens JCM 14089]